MKLFKSKQTDERAIMTEMIRQAFSAQDERIKIQNEKISALSAENEKLKQLNADLWEVLKKIDDKLSVVYGQVFGQSGEEVSLNMWKYGEEAK